MQDLESGDKVVLKKVECNDEGEANKAFKEVGYVVVLVVNHSPGDGSRATVSQVHLWLQGVLYQLGQSGTCNAYLRHAKSLSYASAADVLCPGGDHVRVYSHGFL